MKAFEIGQAINALVPSAEFTLVGDNYADVEWLFPPAIIPTEAEVNEWILQIPIRAAVAATEKAALLAKLGITADEAKLLLS